MSDRAKRLGLEPGSVFSHIPSGDPLEQEIAHSIARSLKRIADRLDDIASGTATIRVQNEF